jgi:hypothetical protein
MARPGRESAASALATALGLTTSAVQPLPAGEGADVRVVLGQDYHLP